MDRYAQRARERFAERFHAFSAFVADIERDPLPIVPVRLAFGALVFEYVDPAAAMRNVTPLLEPGGALVTVIQLPGSAAEAVTPSPYEAIQRLSGVMRLRSVEEMRAAAERSGFTEVDVCNTESSAGKRFAIQVFTIPEKPRQYA